MSENNTKSGNKSTDYSNNSLDYWNLMHKVRYHLIYSDLYFQHYANIVRRFKCLQLIAGSGTIAAWQIWQKCPIIWFLILMASQLYNLLEGVLPYSSRKEELRVIKEKLAYLSFEMEADWRSTVFDSNDEKLIKKLCNKYSGAYAKMVTECLPDDRIPDDEDFKKKAESEADLYLKNTFGR